MIDPRSYVHACIVSREYRLNEKTQSPTNDASNQQNHVRRIIDYTTVEKQRHGSNCVQPCREFYFARNSISYRKWQKGCLAFLLLSLKQYSSWFQSATKAQISKSQSMASPRFLAPTKDNAKWSPDATVRALCTLVMYCWGRSPH